MVNDMGLFHFQLLVSAGCNALHHLMEHAKNNKEITCWDGKTLSVCEAWLGLASLLMEVGCDPRLLDHRHRPPHQLPVAAQKPRLASLLSKVRHVS